MTFDMDHPMAGRAIDLSPMGMWAVARQPFAVGEQVVVSFRPPYGRADRELTIFGEVARVTMERCGRGGTATGLGIEFVGLSADERAELEQSLVGTPPPIPPHLQHA
jgi:hypothetical protein